MDSRLDGRKMGHPRMLSQIPEKVDEIMDKGKGEWILEKVEPWISNEENIVIQGILISQRE